MGFMPPIIGFMPPPMGFMPPIIGFMPPHGSMPHALAVVVYDSKPAPNISIPNSDFI
jgi:hypothetical protein